MKPVFAVRNCFVEFSKTKRQGNKKFIIELRKTATDFWREIVEEYAK